MIKAVLIALFALFALANCQTFEGVYMWTTDENITIPVSVCVNGTSVYGNMDDIGIFYADMQSSGVTGVDIAIGKYFYLGDLYTGTRVSFKRFTGGRGRIGLVYNENSTTLFAFVLPRDATGASNGTLLFSLAKNSTDVGTDRVRNCAIIDRTATDNVSGYWNTSAKSQVKAAICLTSNVHGRADSIMYGSYTFHFTFDYSNEILPGYFAGYCVANAQVCGTVFYQNDLNYNGYTSFGAELIYRLYDDRLIIAHTRGAPGITGFSTYNIGVNPLDRAGTASNSTCTKYDSNYFNPAACRSMSLKLCKTLTEYGFCEVASKQGSCIRTKFVA